MKKLVTLALVPLFALPAPALADNCRHAGYGYTPTYAPTYSYTPTYYDYDRVIVVARAVAVDRPLYAYTGVQDDVRRFYELKRAVKEGTLEALLEHQASQPPTPPPVPDGPPVPPLAAPRGAPPIPQAKGPKSASGIKAVLASRCASCHNPKTDADRVDLSIDPDRIDPIVAGLCSTQVTANAMPKKGGPLPQDEFDVVVKWGDGKLAAALSLAIQQSKK